jgi:hypothetical protein
MGQAIWLRDPAQQAGAFDCQDWPGDARRPGRNRVGGGQKIVQLSNCLRRCDGASWDFGRHDETLPIPIGGLGAGFLVFKWPAPFEVVRPEVWF